MGIKEDVRIKSGANTVRRHDDRVRAVAKKENAEAAASGQ